MFSRRRFAPLAIVLLSCGSEESVVAPPNGTSSCMCDETSFCCNGGCLPYGSVCGPPTPNRPPGDADAGSLPESATEPLDSSVEAEGDCQLETETESSDVWQDAPVPIDGSSDSDSALVDGGSDGTAPMCDPRTFAPYCDEDMTVTCFCNSDTDRCHVSYGPCADKVCKMVADEGVTFPLCVAKDSVTCDPSEFPQCVDNVGYTCEFGYTWRSSTECDETTKCVVTDAGWFACADPASQPCDPDTHVRFCDDNREVECGAGWTYFTPCGEEEVCYDAESGEPECIDESMTPCDPESNPLSCPDEGSVRVCSASGFTATAPCPSDRPICLEFGDWAGCWPEDTEVCDPASFADSCVDGKLVWCTPFADDGYKRSADCAQAGRVCWQNATGAWLCAPPNPQPCNTLEFHRHCKDNARVFCSTDPRTDVQDGFVESYSCGSDMCVESCGQGTCEEGEIPDSILCIPRDT